MEKYLKKLWMFLLIFAAIAMWNAPKATAATVTSKAKYIDNTDKACENRWDINGTNFKFKPANNVELKDCFLQVSNHYKWSPDENTTYRIVGGCYYVDNNGYLSTSTDANLIKPYYVTDANGNVVRCNQYKKASANGEIGKKVAKIVSSGATFRGDTNYYSWNSGSISLTGKNVVEAGENSANFQWKNAPICFRTDQKEVFLVPNASTPLNGMAADERIWRYVNTKSTKINQLYNGYAYKGGKMYKVSSGKIGSLYTGVAGQYYDVASNSFKTSGRTFKDGVLVSGWVTSGSLTYGIYKNGLLDQTKNYWIKKEEGKWYYFEKGKIYRNSNKKKGVAGKKLKSTNLKYFGHKKASPGSYRYYLNADGSLITNVFAADSSWYKKKMRIYVNCKPGVDNVTFMGYVKGSGFCVPLKTIVTTCSKKKATLKKQIRGSKGKGKWKLGRTSKSRLRWFVFKKKGHKFYYQYATSIIGSGALFHSPRFLSPYNIRSLYRTHFNAMGKKNITTKCVRVQVANALMVYTISQKCKSYNYVTFVKKGTTNKKAYLPFGNTELEDTVGTSNWTKNYDPSDPGIK